MSDRKGISFWLVPAIVLLAISSACGGGEPAQPAQPAEVVEEPAAEPAEYKFK